MGVQVGHETLKADGLVSWWHAGFHQNGFFKGMLDDKVQTLKAEKILHYMRNPIQAIPSIILENEASQRNNISFKHRRGTIKKYFGVDIAEMGPVGAAASSYIYWNRICQDIAMSPPIYIEIPDLSALGVAINKLPVRNTSHEKFGHAPAELQIDDIARGAPTSVAQQIFDIAHTYPRQR
ncbi:hypothetical protein [Pseudohoeflea coraliihabitans]|uniref:Uncharacterized protein n=1 Tax=Pseudohoeflea coraliihabitans TaxID=2860393 RepID=A0ABS6WIU1_9HYPH|nr:hypothetical protein [Pseudohoeflea sp. DP4N28-3]MBW3095856.1 hypothetical protein [Pseudohoeflea sp. DP4N28-3]